MHIRNIAIAAAAAAILSPAICSAGNEKLTLHACVTAFEKSLAESGESSPAFKLVYDHAPISGSALQYYTTAYTYDLQANDAKSGAVFARARCVVDRRGTVSSLDALPLPAESTSRTARTLAHSANY
jgi:hypothetical protein